MTLKIEDLAYEKLPKQRIFLSIDIIGSTKLKTISYDEAETYESKNGLKYNGFWLDSLLDFFSSITTFYSIEFNKTIKFCLNKDCCIRNLELTKEYSNIKCVSPPIWKFVGDEVILMTELSCPIQPYCYVKTLVNVIKDLNFKNAESSKSAHNGKISNKTLQFKGTAWVGGFPVTNAHVNLYNDNIANIYDFIGPSIDLGFRLSKFSTKSKLVLSASLVKLLFDMPIDIKTMDLEIYSDGFVEIKGIKEEIHPLFWTFISNEDDREKSLFTPLSNKKINEFLNKYFDEYNRPFILNPNRDNITEAYKKNLLDAIQHQSNLVLSLYNKYYLNDEKENKQKKESLIHQINNLN